VTAEPPFTEAFASVWTGNELIVAFRPGGNIRFATYNPTHNQWQTLPDPPITITAPFTDSSTFVWTGTTALVWAFQNTGPSTSDGHHRLLSYNPTTKQWARLADPPIDGLIQAHPIWTGRELIVWGGSGQPSTALGQGAAYDPARNHWRTIALGPLSSRENPMITWTGQEMIVWGGLTSSTDRLEGAAYNPATDTWRIMPRSGLPTLELAATAWTGHEMIVYGTPPAGGTLAGGAYNPTTNRWRNLLPAGQPGARDLPAWTWTGRQLIVWGGLQYIHGRQTVSDGAAYNPTDDQWTPLPFPPIAARHSALMAWTGQLAIILGGYGPSQLGASSEPPALHAAAYRP
jgi:hypothetical protein